MAKNTGAMAKGIGIGMVTGAAALALGSMVMQNSKSGGMKNMKKTAGKAVHSVTELLGGVESMLR